MKAFSIFVAFLVAALVIAVVIAAFARRRPALAGSYRQMKPLSDAEQALYWRLVEALPECVILSQVTFSRFMAAEVRGPNSWRERMRLHGAIAQKSIDFLVCLKDFTVVAAIELDDGSHDLEKDAKRDALLTAAGIHVLRFNVRDIPSADVLRKSIAE